MRLDMPAHAPRPFVIVRANWLLMAALAWLPIIAAFMALRAWFGVGA